MSFTALRDAAPLPPGVSAGKFFLERLRELAGGATALATNGDARTIQSSRIINDLLLRAERNFANIEQDSGVMNAPAPQVAHPV